MKKNSVSLILMLSSIVLLIVLQVLWLRNSYEKAFYDFNRESNFIFRNTVLTMRDSLFERRIERVSDSSIEARTAFGITGLPDTFLRDSLGKKVNAADINYIKVNDTGKQIKIFVAESGHPDSVKGMLRPLAARIRRVKGSQNFIIRMGPDSLSTDSIIHFYKAALLKANLDTSFKITHLHISEENFHRTLDRLDPGREGLDEMKSGKLRPFIDTLQTEFVHINPLNQYAASFPGIRLSLIKKISPQIFFSLFLTLITIGSFIMIYRNMRAQQRLMELKNDFISNVTHELKTPVATVSVALEALKSFQAKDNPTLTAEYLDIAQRELNRLSVMTDKILKTTIFEAKGVEFEPEDIDLDKTIEDMMRSMKLTFEERNAKVTYEKTGDNFQLRGGPMHLTNVMYNLIDNALKYSPENPVIHIHLKDEHSLLILTVKDNGMGIAKEHQGRVFEKFYRIPSGDVHNTKGYGLGLSYVASVIKSHYGLIEVFSEPGRGSEFKITLPKPPGRIFKKAIKL